MWRFFTDIFGNSEQSFTEQLFTAIGNIGPDFFLIYEISVSKNIWILLSIINDEIGCYKPGLDKVFNPLTRINNGQRLKINAVIQLINHVVTVRDREYLKNIAFPMQHNNVENVQFYSHYIDPIIFYFVSKNLTLYKSLEAKTLLSLIQDLDEIKFDIVKKFVRKFLDISIDRPLDTQLEQMLLQERMLICVTNQAKTDPSFAPRCNAILSYECFIKLLALVDQQLENLRETYFSIPESQERIIAFAWRFSKLKGHGDKNFSSIYDLKITDEELNKLCINFHFYITEATNLCGEIKGYQFSKDQLVQEIQKQKKSFHELISQIEIPVDLTRSEERKDIEQKPAQKELESELLDKGKRVLEKQKSSLVEKIIWGWYLGYAIGHVGIKLSEESAYEVLVDAYKENQLILKKLSGLKDFFSSLLLYKKQYEWKQQQTREKLLGLLSETMRNKIISINRAIEPLLQILFYSEEKHERLNLFIGIVNLVVETDKMWVRNVEGKDILSLSVDDICNGTNNVDRLDKVKSALSEFSVNSGLWGILKRLQALEDSLESKKREKENLQIEIENKDRNKKLEFIGILDDFKKGIQQKIPQYERNIRTGHGENVMVLIGYVAEKECLINRILEILNRLNDVEERKIPFMQWIEEILRVLGNKKVFENKGGQNVKLDDLLQCQLGTLKECCNALKKEFDAYLKVTKQKLEELNNEILELERQLQRIQDTASRTISNLDEKAKSVDFGLREEKKIMALKKMCYLKQNC